MGGDERMYHAKELAPGFDLARASGLAITTHAGEFGGAASIRESLTYLKPSRIGHGVRAIEASELVKELADKRIVLECCPGSNIALSVFDSFAEHPFMALREAGVPVTLNSDDPPHFHTSLTREYDIGATEFGLSDADLREITRTAINAAFVDGQTRLTLLVKSRSLKMQSSLRCPSKENSPPNQESSFIARNAFEMERSIKCVAGDGLWREDIITPMLRLVNTEDRTLMYRKVPVSISSRKPILE